MEFSLKCEIGATFVLIKWSFEIVDAVSAHLVVCPSAAKRN